MRDPCSRLDEYRIARKIGTGYSADVYEAELNDRKMALKIFKERATNFAENEYTRGKGLMHPHIIDYEEYRQEAIFTQGDSIGCRQAIAMELAPKGEIFDLVDRLGGFPEIVARTYFHMLIDALEYIHDCGIVHLDIKAQNLLLDDKYLLKVSDFGFAQDSREYVHRKVGTEGYMSPEIESNEGSKGEQADTFAAGVVLFIMATGFQPFKSTRPEDVYYSTLNSKPSRFWATYKSKPLCSKFKDLIEKMLCSNPDRRLTLSQIKQHPWYCEDILLNRDLTNTIGKLLRNDKTSD